MLMNKLIFILILLDSIYKFTLYTGYQGELSQLEFLSRILGSLTIALISIIFLNKKK